MDSSASNTPSMCPGKYQYPSKDYTQTAIDKFGINIFGTNNSKQQSKDVNVPSPGTSYTDQSVPV